MSLPAPWQFTYAGVTIGDGTQYQVDQVAGLIDLPPVRSYAAQRMGQSGVFSSPWYTNGRVVTFQLTVVPGAVPAVKAAQQLASAWTQLTSPQPLVYTLGSAASALVMGRPTKITNTANVEVLFGLVRMAIEFTCDDPRIYGTIAAPWPANPAGVPQQYATPTAATAVATNNGTATAYPDLYLTIPSGSGAFTVQDNAGDFQVLIAANAPTALTISGSTQQLYGGSGGPTTQAPAFFNGGSFPLIPAGATLTYSTSLAGITLSAHWCDTYLSGGPQ